MIPADGSLTTSDAHIASWNAETERLADELAAHGMRLRIETDSEGYHQLRFN